MSQISVVAVKPLQNGSMKRLVITLFTFKIAFYIPIIGYYKKCSKVKHEDSVATIILHYWRYVTIGLKMSRFL